MEKNMDSYPIYFFGYRSCYGHFDEFIFKKSDANRLQRVVDYLKIIN